MGKVTGFMELDRVERDYEPVEDRIKHFKEFLIPLDKKKFQNKVLDVWIVGFHIVIKVVLLIT